MKKKSIFILLGVAVVLASLVALAVLRYKTTSKIPSSVQTSAAPTPVEELTLWKDQSGFSIQYPKSLNLNPHDEDQENYAHLELTSATHAGNLIVWTKDTTAETIEDWVKQAKIEGAIDTTLGGEPAKKILTNEGDRKLMVTTINGGYLYQIETNLADYDFWNSIYDKVFSSFIFIPLEEETKEKTKQQYVPEESNESDIEEEVIE